jgi:hypothetical protein
MPRCTRWPTARTLGSAAAFTRCDSASSRLGACSSCCTFWPTRPYPADRSVAKMFRRYCRDGRYCCDVVQFEGHSQGKRSKSGAPPLPQA